MADVFISYHETSAGRLAEQIANALDAAGISSWCARRDLPPGADFSGYIPQAIRACKLFLLILNEESNQSEHVKSELNLAFRRINKHERITLIPFKVDSCVISDSVDYFINRFQIIDANPPDPQRVQSLIRRIADILHKTPQSLQPLQSLQSLQLMQWALDLPFPQIAQPSASVIRSGFCGDLVHYTLDSYGVLTISGFGPMWDYDLDKQTTATMPWRMKRNMISGALIQDGVTSIGNRAFERCKKLKSVTISDSVTSVGNLAFCNCHSLTSISLPNHVTGIGAYAFAYCRNLASVTVPDSVTEIKVGAFEDCQNLKSVSVPKRTRIDYGAFPKTTQMIRRPS